MAKLRDKRKLLWCLKQFNQGKSSQKWLSSYLGITTRRFRQLYTPTNKPNKHLTWDQTLADPKNPYRTIQANSRTSLP
ncbi:MAG: hypothetical protein LBH62_07110 [Nitrososphaerota archaeon]|nr:hypothetical protein [Nitrososphaerota archaeon]